MPIAELLPQTIALIGYSPRGFDDEMPFISEALKALAAFYNRAAQFRFQLLNRCGKGRLGNVTSGGSAGEVALFSQCHQVFYLPAEHDLFRLPGLLYARAVAPEIDLPNGFHRPCR